MVDWQRIGGVMKPGPGTKILVFTPTSTDLRYRIIDADLIRTVSEATHWTYLTPPAAYWSEEHDAKPKYEIV
jgi:hypothetical protein